MTEPTIREPNNRAILKSFCEIMQQDNQLINLSDKNNKLLKENIENLSNVFQSYQNIVFDFLNTNNLGNQYYQFVKDLKKRAENGEDKLEFVDLYDVYGDIDSVYEMAKLDFSRKEEIAE